MRVLQIGADRSRRGILVPGSAAYLRQKAYATQFGELDIVAFSMKSDGFSRRDDSCLHIIPTNSRFKLLFGFDAYWLARTREKPAVVSTQDPFETGLIALIIARMFGVPLHVQVHTDFLSPDYAALSTLNRLRTLIAGFVLRRAFRIRVVSNRIKSSLTHTYKKLPEISVLPIFAELATTGSADAALAERLNRFSKVVLVVARLEPEKNVTLAIRSFAAAAPSDACLIIVGSGSQRAVLEHVARQSHAHERIFFEGERDASLYYPIADLVLVTSLYEGYGLVIAEALARKIPVLSTDVGAARELGAIIARPDEFDSALSDWFKKGPETASLSGYPYATFEQYVKAYCDDIAACAATK